MLELSFQQLGRRQDGTVLAGWRTMDVHQKGYLCYAEFCQSCREMLFNGDIRSLWRELDANEKGIVTLKAGSKKHCSKHKINSHLTFPDASFFPRAPAKGSS